MGTYNSQLSFWRHHPNCPLFPGHSSVIDVILISKLVRALLLSLPADQMDELPRRVLGECCAGSRRPV
jgi:hypothetical protein